MIEPVSIEAVKKQAVGHSLAAMIHVQVELIAVKATRDQRPYLELNLRDASGFWRLPVWSDTPGHGFCQSLRPGDFVAIEGEFALHPQFGLEARQWSIRFLTETERQALFIGSPEIRRKQDADYVAIQDLVGTIRDPRLRRLCELFLSEYEDRFRRAAAARSYHHARRGGLVEHVAQMMRSAAAFASVYRELNRDLLLAGVLFHDAGKLWENIYGKESFLMPYDLWGELVGHISIGIELVNRLWHRLKQEPAYASWSGLKPDPELVRAHLVHLVAAHHGQREFGSPVEPKTPEAVALHFIDNLDAKLETVFAAYQNPTMLSSEIVERVRPWPTNLVLPLKEFEDGRQGDQ
jgi:3'-5' exoribonuclease